MANRRTLIVFVSALAMAGALMAGCDRPHDNSSGSSGGGQFPQDNAAAQVTSPAPGSAGCAQVGALTGAKLPALDSEFKIVADNPCLPSTELLDRVTSLIPQEDSPGFCYETNSDNRGDQDYTIMWISDSSHMCEALRGSLVPGDGAIVAVHADPDVALRSGPTTGDAVIRSLPNQTMGHAQCKTTGESVADGDDVWIKTEALGSTGYIAQSYLEGNTLRAGDDLPNC